jgi:type IV secretory pathway VirB3-like protein
MYLRVCASDIAGVVAMVVLVLVQLLLLLLLLLPLLCAYLLCLHNNPNYPRRALC